MEATFKHNGFSYSVDVDKQSGKGKFEIQSSKKCPEFLFKYYPLNRYSVNALVSSYLYSSHPMQLNDKYDCSSELVDYSVVDINLYKKVFLELNIFTEKEIESLYYSDNKWILERRFGEFIQLELYKKCGIISLTSRGIEPLMWGHYANNSGFAVKFKAFELSKKLNGAFPINYTDDLTKIEYNKNLPELAILYQTNVKSRMWENEDEWRYFTFNKDGKYHPYWFPKDVKSRFNFYSKDAIEEIILGYDFINPLEVDYPNKTNKVTPINLNKKKIRASRKQKRRFLQFLVKNKINCKIIFRHRAFYELEAKKIEIEQVSTNRFNIHHSWS